MTIYHCLNLAAETLLDEDDGDSMVVDVDDKIHLVAVKYFLR